MAIADESPLIGRHFVALSGNVCRVERNIGLKTEATAYAAWKKQMKEDTE